MKGHKESHITMSTARNLPVPQRTNLWVRGDRFCGLNEHDLPP